MGDAAVSSVQPDLGLEFADRPEATAKTVADLWRADLAEAEVLVRAQPDSAAWNTASLRWIVAPPDGELTRAGNRAIGAVDVEMIRSTADAFSMLDGKFGGGHARRALIQYLHTDVRPMLDGKYSDDVGKQLYSAVAEALLLAGWMSYDSGLHGIRGDASEHLREQSRCVGRLTALEHEAAHRHRQHDDRRAYHNPRTLHSSPPGRSCPDQTARVTSDLVPPTLAFRATRSHE